MDIKTRKKWRDGFKVVTAVQKTKFLSYNFGLEQPNCVIYKIGKASKPRKGNGPLVVFEKLDFALSFLETYRNDNTLILKVCYKPCRKEYAWLMNERQRVSIHLRYLPEGSKLADRVKPIAIIKNAKNQHTRDI